MSDGGREADDDVPGSGEARPLRELLTVELQTSDLGVEVVVRGELDESTAPGMIRQIEAVIAPDRDLSIDVSGLTFCGSAGLSALIILERAVTAAGGSLAVERPTPFMVELLEIAGLEGLIVPGSAP